MRRNGTLLLCTLLIAFHAPAAQEPESWPNPAQFQEFVTRMVERVPSGYREHLGLPAACSTYDGTSICPWTGIFSQGFDICLARTHGYSHACIKKLLLPTDDNSEGNASFQDALIDVSAEVICPEVVTGSPQVAPAPTLKGNAQEEGVRPDPKKDQEFIEVMIQRLPADVRGCYRDLCRTYDKERCPLWGFSAAYGEAVCDALGSGQSREELLQGSEGFFSESELAAIVDTAIEVICPQYRTK